MPLHPFRVATWYVFGYVFETFRFITTASPSLRWKRSTLHRLLLCLQVCACRGVLRVDCKCGLRHFEEMTDAREDTG